MRAQPLYARQRTPVPTEWKVGWAPKPVWIFCRREKYLALPGFEPRLVQTVAYLVYRLSYPASLPYCCMNVGEGGVVRSSANISFNFFRIL